MNNNNRGHEFDANFISGATIEDMLNTATEARSKQIREKQIKNEIVNEYKSKTKGGSLS